MKAEQEVNGEREERMEAKGSKGKRRSGRSEKMCVYVLGSVNAGVGESRRVVDHISGGLHSSVV